MRRSVRCSRLPMLLVLGASLLAGCAAKPGDPAIDTVRPGAVAPGGLVLVSGRGFAREDGVWVAGRELANVSWVNGTLLATTLPADLPEGSHTLEVRSAGGRRASIPVQVAAVLPSLPQDAAAAPTVPVAPTPEPAVTTQPTPAPTRPPALLVPATPTPRPANPPRGDDKDDKDDKDDDKKNNGRGNGGGGRGR